MGDRLKKKQVEENEENTREEENESDIQELAKLYVELTLTEPDGNSKEITQGHDKASGTNQDINQENEDPSSSEGNLRRPARATSALSPRQINSNVRTLDQLALSTSDTCLSSAHQTKNVNWKKLDAVCSSSGDGESSNSERPKTKKQGQQIKKTRFANEVEVLHYEQDSGDKYWTTEPLADETDQQQRSYKNRDDRLDVTYPNISPASYLEDPRGFLARTNYLLRRYSEISSVYLPTGLNCKLKRNRRIKIIQVERNH